MTLKKIVNICALIFGLGLAASASATVQLIYDPNGTTFTLHYDGAKTIILTKCTALVVGNAPCTGTVRGKMDYNLFLHNLQTAQGTQPYWVNENGAENLNNALAQASRDVQDPSLSPSERQRAQELVLRLSQMVPKLDRTAELWEALNVNNPFFIIHEYRDDFYDVLNLFGILNRTCTARVNLMYTSSDGRKFYAYKMATLCVLGGGDPSFLDIKWTQRGRTSEDDFGIWLNQARATSRAQGLGSMNPFCVRDDLNCSCAWEVFKTNTVTCGEYLF